ncbi:threonine/serine dehydratase [Bradyrhizobium sp. sBnM-33]|uniref:threonine ammonia-lyase n=1 Tax=Bradyrhizobium sp. sBnM-33 TaxID=2831780 RepID=UPI001BD01473|nr:threonine/serine dehydratase [Bradyrhizobium sp. sBnM-33]WOH52588.1 threonine/serine dehydratase [Bradyrhizobium sp. sBnM-33]
MRTGDEPSIGRSAAEISCPSAPVEMFSDLSDWFIQPPTCDDVLRARREIENHVRVTPLLESESLNHSVGGRILVKAEGLQVTGSFKTRGVLNRLSFLRAEQLRNEVVCYSSGNHGHAVSWASRRRDCKALIVMPHDAPTVKVDAVRSYGAEVRMYDRRTEDREEIVKEIAFERSATIIHPHNDRAIIAGAATLGVEVQVQAKEMGLKLDAIIAGCGGGGLAAGCAIACPALELSIIEPLGFDDMARSLKFGHRVRNSPEATSICDALLAPTPSDLPFRILCGRSVHSMSVTDHEVRLAMRFAARHFGLIAEPGGILPLAAILAGRLNVRGRTSVAVISGSNVDLETYTAALAV